MEFIETERKALVGSDLRPVTDTKSHKHLWPVGVSDWNLWKNLFLCLNMILTLKQYLITVSGHTILPIKSTDLVTPLLFGVLIKSNQLPGPVNG